MHGRVVVVEVPLDQLQGLDGDHRHAARRLGVVLGLGLGRHLRQAAAVGADHRDRLVRQLHEDAAQGVAGALDVGGEHRPADQSAEVRGADDVVARCGEVGDLGEEVGVLGRQAELRAEAADGQSVGVGLERELLVEAGGEDLLHLGRGQDHRAGLVDLHAEDAISDADLEVGGHQGRAVVGVGDELEVLEDRLGAPRRGDPGDRPERREQSLAVAQRLHALASLLDRRRRPALLFFMRDRYTTRRLLRRGDDAPWITRGDPDQAHATQRLIRPQCRLFTGGKPVDRAVAQPGMSRGVRGSAPGHRAEMSRT